MVGLLFARSRKRNFLDRPFTLAGRNPVRTGGFMPKQEDSDPLRKPSKRLASDGDAHSGMTRRGFLRGAGVTAAGTALHGSLHAIGREPDMANLSDVRRLGPDPASVTIHVNGKEYPLQMEPRVTLAEALRMQLGMTGTKVACDHGACSSCTVLLDGAPVNSCMMLGVEVGPRRIVTIEGIALNGVLHPLQAAFVKYDAMQCGFCTPGMVMSCVSLLERNAKPSLEDVRCAISGNLCRCGSYARICDATLDAAATIASRTM
jgi:aerobic-type carbon monoxide dehydrogenase small subunit (CoxS/CutS family)